MYAKKLVSLVLFCLLFSIGCAHSPNNPKLPVNSFLFVDGATLVRFCSEEAGTCGSKSIKFSGSGVIIDSDGEGSYILTAAHICEAPNFPILRSMGYDLKAYNELKVVTIEEEKFSTRILTFDVKKDICMIYAKGLTQLPAIKLAYAEPKIGERVYNISAPRGIWGKRAVPILEGRYCGILTKYNSAMYSIPAAPGSSGSMILNHKGRLIGILHSIFTHYNQLTLATTYDDTKEFIQKNIKKYKLYKKSMGELELEDIFDPKNDPKFSSHS